MKNHNIILNKDARYVLDRLAKLKKNNKINNLYELDHLESRKEFKKIRNFFKQKNREEVTWSKNIRVKNFKIRHYRSIKKSPKEILPVMIFFHGGGWVVGDLDTHDEICRRLVNNSKFDLISVHYSLAPENPFPKAFLDAVDTIKWLVKNHEHLNIELEKILLCGDSAGGNLVAALGIYNREFLKRNIIYQILIYPVTIFSSNFPSKIKYDGIILSAKLMNWFEEKYLPRKDRIKYLNDWRLSPAKAGNLKNLPKTLLILAECDPLFDEGKYFASELKKIIMKLS